MTREVEDERTERAGARRDTCVSDVRLEPERPARLGVEWGGRSVAADRGREARERIECVGRGEALCK
jgi:hypothetical protein